MRLMKIDTPRQNATWWKAQAANRLNGMDWRQNLPKSINPSAHPQVESIIDKSLGDIKELQKQQIQEGRMAVVLSTRLSDLPILEKSLHSLVSQMKEAGMNGEIFAVINRGGEAGDRYLKNLDAFDGISNVLKGKTLRNGQTGDTHAPGQVVLDDGKVLQNKGIKLVFINQEDLPVNDGKIRAIRDVYTYLEGLTANSQYRPQYLFAMDCETTLYPVNRDTGTLDLKSNKGLSNLIRETDSGRRLVGAKTRLVPFSDDGNADWNAKVPVLAQVVSAIHGEKAPKGFNLAVKLFTKRTMGPVDGIPASWMGGGATLGDYAQMTGLMKNISQTFPSLRVEDTMFSLLSRLMGIEIHVDTGTVHTNRCPRETPEDHALMNLKEFKIDKKTFKNGGNPRLTMGELLLGRWFCGNEGIKSVAGELFNLVTEEHPALNRYMIIAGGFLKKFGSLVEAIIGLHRSRTLVVAYSQKYPDEPYNGKSSW